LACWARWAAGTAGEIAPGALGGFLDVLIQKNQKWPGFFDKAWQRQLPLKNG
jgi:hypothetical protein